MGAFDVETYEPADVPQPIADGLWIVDGPLEGMVFGPVRVPFPTRMTIVRLSSGDLWLHSPTRWTPALQEAVAALGPVTHLVSPNFIHYAHIGAWKQANPHATTWASPGVRKRAASQAIDVTFDADLTDEPPAAWAAEIDQVLVRGSFVLVEVVFHHRASRTVILTDLVMNFEDDRLGWGFRAVARAGGAVAPAGQTPLDVRWTFIGGMSQARPALQRVVGWEPERVVLSHGRWFREDGAAELRRAFAWAGV